ncbi:hypothetical protein CAUPRSCDRAFT_12695 [Caulochytrium protostelioides]|uniref:Uncharacterized protein n=1 Tax=Caulochytrium protostelioides TaxID=1555241 RepID=A0A4P9WWK9_9FUNG|nr:hypothetical protein CAUPRSCDRAFT_12695 [Caulochytrium protostelioides]
MQQPVVNLDLETTPVVPDPAPPTGRPSGVAGVHSPLTPLAKRPSVSSPLVPSPHAANPNGAPSTNGAPTTLLNRVAFGAELLHFEARVLTKAIDAMMSSGTYGASTPSGGAQDAQSLLRSQLVLSQIYLGSTFAPPAHLPKQARRSSIADFIHMSSKIPPPMFTMSKVDAIWLLTLGSTITGIREHARALIDPERHLKLAAAGLSHTTVPTLGHLQTDLLVGLTTVEPNDGMLPAVQIFGKIKSALAKRAMPVQGAAVAPPAATAARLLDYGLATIGFAAERLERMDPGR